MAAFEPFFMARDHRVEPIPEKEIRHICKTIMTQLEAE
jgi:hypothetical protein